MRTFTVYAPAKLNLYLNVLGRRSDGYHDIETLFEKIDLKDEIIVKEKISGGIDVIVEPAGACPAGRENIVYKAASALLKEAGANTCLEIIIRKRIPVSAGLGGGSSDAASILRSLNRYLGLGLSSERLFSIADEIGKDIPFFMLDETFAVGKGAGGMLEPLNADTSFAHIIITPDLAISAAAMYKRIGGLKKDIKKPQLGPAVSAVKDRNAARLRASSYNIFEEALGEYRAPVQDAKKILLDCGAGASFLSGKGPSVFSVFSGREEAARALDRIPNDRGLKVFMAMSYKGGIYGDHGSQDFPKRRAE